MCIILIIFLFISFLLLKYIWINKLHIICSSFMSKCIYHPVNKSRIRYKNWICYEWMVRLFSFREDTLCPLRVRRRKRDGHVHFITVKFLNQLFGHIFKFCFFFQGWYSLATPILNVYYPFWCIIITTECVFQLI